MDFFVYLCVRNLKAGVMKNTVLILIFTLLVQSLAIASVPATKYTRVVPLPVSDNVRVAVFDENGFLWIGTTAGLLRYDGYQFIQYRNTSSQPLTLSDNSIWSLSADGKGCLWVGTDNGVTRLDMRTGQTKIYPMPTARQKSVMCIYVSPDGRVFAGTGSGVLRYDEKAGKFVPVLKPAISNIKAIACDKEGNLFVGTGSDGLWVARHGQSKMERVAVEGNDFYCLRFDKRGRLWTTGWHEGVKLITGAASRHPKVRFFPGTDFASVYNIIEMSDGSMMACSRNVIYKFDTSLKMTEEHDASHNINACLAVNSGTGTVALAKKVGEVDFSSTSTTPLTVLDVPPYDDGLSRGGINSMITIDGNAFWLFSRMSGVSTLNATLDHSSHDASISILRGISDDMKNSSCQSSLLDSKGNVWIGNTFFGLLSIRTNGRVETFDKGSRRYLRETGVYSIAEDRQGRLWFGQTNNVVVVNPNGSGFNIPLKRYIQGINNDEVTHFLQDSFGRIWICTRNYGLLRIDKLSADGKLIKATPLNQRNGKFTANGAVSCIEDGRGSIFFVTSAGELLRWDEKKGKCANGNNGDLQNDERFYSAITDARGNVWLATANYLVRLQSDGKTTDIRRFYIPLHSSDISFQENSVFRLGDILYFGATNTIVAVNTKLTDLDKSVNTRLALTGISLDGQDYNSLDPSLRKKCSDYLPAYTRKIVVPHGIRLVSLSFANMNFADDVAGCYAYKLGGYNDDWVMIPSGSHSATFANLPSGKYMFHVRCTDTNGRWVEMPYAVVIHVLPPWWATWWAYVLYTLLFIVAVYCCILLYRRHIRTQNRLQIARVFTNLTHELLTPISIISASVEGGEGKRGQHCILCHTQQHCTSDTAHKADIRSGQAQLWQDGAAGRRGRP